MSARASRQFVPLHRRMGSKTRSWARTAPCVTRIDGPRARGQSPHGPEEHRVPLGTKPGTMEICGSLRYPFSGTPQNTRSTPKARQQILHTTTLAPKHSSNRTRSRISAGFPPRGGPLRRSGSTVRRRWYSSVRISSPQVGPCAEGQLSRGKERGRRETPRSSGTRLEKPRNSWPDTFPVECAMQYC